jgi:hypothetical protein
MESEIRKVELLLSSGGILYKFSGKELPFMRLWVHAGDEVVFKSAFPFAIHFSPVSPFPYLDGAGERKNKTKSEPFCLSMRIRDDIEPGYYKFFVALAVENRVYTDDPDLIVDPQRPRRF